jgi:hypothetical protein
MFILLYVLVLCVVPVMAQQRDGCEETVTPHIRVDPGHAWRPPFGVDRVGRPLAVYVELTAEHSPLREYYLSGYRGGKETERHLLNVMRGKSPFADTAEFRSFPEQVALFARCRFDGRLEELNRQTVSWPDFEAEAAARPDRLINPVDLGTILVPHDWLLLAGGQSTLIDAAAISHAREIPNARVRAWFESGKPAELGIPLALNQRSAKELELPFTSTGDRDVLHVAIVDGNRELWKKEIRTMVVARPPKWPTFGAVETKLRYDAPISVKDTQTGALSSIPYDTAWDAKLNDTVVFLPNGSRYVFWRGSSYIPFWAGIKNTGFCYEWAETTPPPDGFVDSVEPLMDKELRYGRVRIMESTASRIHVRWTYQSTDFMYKVWGDQATEDYYFYPDGFGTRVLTLTSSPGADYELTEFIVLTPQSAFPLDILPSHLADMLFLDGQKKTITFPFRPEKDVPAGQPANKLTNPRQMPVVYRIYDAKDDPAAAIYFNPRDPTTPSAFEPFYDRGVMVTPAYWGSHWPLGRGKSTGYAIDDRIYSNPGHNSLMTWGMGNRPKPLSTSAVQMLDTLGRAREMTVQRWAWMIAKTDATDDTLLDWAQSYSYPPSLEVTGAHIDFPSYSQERRAIRLVADSPAIDIHLKPVSRYVNPVFELAQSPKQLASVILDGKPLAADSYAWDGATLWMKATIHGAAEVGLRFK